MKRMPKFRLVAPLFLAGSVLIGSAAFLLGQESFVEGVVVDREGNPVPNAKIVFTEKRQGIKFTLKTNKAGKFMKVGMPYGPYLISAEADGYVPLDGDVNVDPGRNPGLKLVLEKIPVKAKPDPDMAEGTRLFQAGQFKEAAASFQKAVERVPESIEANYALALCLLRSGQVDEAIARFEKVRGWKPDMIEVYLALGESHFGKGETEKALSYFDQALKLQPNSAELHYNIGIIHYKNNQTEKAIEDFIVSIGLDPKYATAYYQLGLAYIKQGDSKKAVENLERFLELQPDAPQAEQVRNIIAQIKK